MGAQVAGFAGKEVQKLTEKKISRIVALDPAGPLFDGRPKEEMLNPNDAENVVVIIPKKTKLGLRRSER